MYEVLRFWLERGVDGFRIDALEVLILEEHLRDNPVNPEWKPGDPPNTRQLERYVVDQPGMVMVCMPSCRRCGRHGPCSVAMPLTIRVFLPGSLLCYRGGNLLASYEWMSGKKMQMKSVTTTNSSQFMV